MKHNTVFEKWLPALRRRLGRRSRKLGLAALTLRLMLLAPTSLAAGGQRTGSHLEAEDVLIEGKLYSPQALFIVSRAEEDFGRDSVVPHYLGTATQQRLLPYRLHREIFAAALAQQAVVGGDSTAAPTESRRSP